MEAEKSRHEEARDDKARRREVPLLRKTGLDSCKVHLRVRLYELQLCMLKHVLQLLLRHLARDRHCTAKRPETTAAKGAAIGARAAEKPGRRLHA